MQGLALTTRLSAPFLGGPVRTALWGGPLPTPSAGNCMIGLGKDLGGRRPQRTAPLREWFLKTTLSKEKLGSEQLTLLQICGSRIFYSMAETAAP